MDEFNFCFFPSNVETKIKRAFSCLQINTVWKHQTLVNNKSAYLPMRSSIGVLLLPVDISEQPMYDHIFIYKINPSNHAPEGIPCYIEAIITFEKFT